MIHTTAASSAYPLLRRHGLSWPLLMALAAFAMSLANCATLLRDPDVMWHIAAGRWMLARGAVPRTDILSHSMPGAAWVPWEWLPEVMMAASTALLGWHGPVVLAGVATAAALALFTRAMLAVLVVRTVNALQGSGDLPALLERYRIGWTLLEPGSPAIALLDRLPGWRRLHTDPIAVVHVRETSTE